MSYVAKYMSKPTDAGDSGFNLNPYLHAGRVWGTLNADNIPFAESITVNTQISYAGFQMLRQIAKTIYPNLNEEYIWNGFTIFMPDPEVVHEWLLEIHRFTYDNQWYAENR